MKLSKDKVNELVLYAHVNDLNLTLVYDNGRIIGYRMVESPPRGYLFEAPDNWRDGLKY